jgi:hypothetical protein
MQGLARLGIELEDVSVDVSTLEVQRVLYSRARVVVTSEFGSIA